MNGTASSSGFYFENNQFVGQVSIPALLPENDFSEGKIAP
jgi:hypothetical protein